MFLFCQIFPLIPALACSDVSIWFCCNMACDEYLWFSESGKDLEFQDTTTGGWNLDCSGSPHWIMGQFFVFKLVFNEETDQQYVYHNSILSVATFSFVPDKYRATNETHR